MTLSFSVMRVAAIGDQPADEFGQTSFTDAPRALREYLRRVKDPMYLNLQKFASTWRVYLEPEKTGRAYRSAYEHNLLIGSGVNVVGRKRG